MISLSTLALILFVTGLIAAWHEAGISVRQSHLWQRHAEAETQRLNAACAAREAVQFAPLRDLPGWPPDALAAMLRQHLPLAILVPEAVWVQVEEAAAGEVCTA